MHVEFAGCALQSLIDETVEHRTAMIAESRPFVAVDAEAMWHVDVEASSGALLQTYLFER